MAVSYRGLTIKFGGDTSDLQDALKKIQKSSKDTQADLKAIEKALKFNPGNTDLLEQKVRKLNAAYDETKDRLDAYKQALQKLEEKKQRGEQLTEEEQRQYDSFKREILKCENQLESYTDQLKKTNDEYKASQTALYQLGQTLEDNADKFSKAGDAMQKVGGVMVGAGATRYNLLTFGSTFWGLRIPLGWWLGHVLWQDASGVFCAMLVSQIVQSLAMCRVLQARRWQNFAMRSHRRGGS